MRYCLVLGAGAFCWSDPLGAALVSVFEFSESGLVMVEDAALEFVSSLLDCCGAGEAEDGASPAGAVDAAGALEVSILVAGGVASVVVLVTAGGVSVVVELLPQPAKKRGSARTSPVKGRGSFIIDYKRTGRANTCCRL
jgi:hypothetical protein